MLLKILFYVFSLILLYAAVRVITARNPVTAVMHLILCFVTTAALWMLIQAEFLGLALVVIYVGAVMVLFLFVVMMIDVSTELVKQGFIKYLPLGIVLIMIVEMGMVLVGKQSVFSETHPYAVEIVSSAVSASYSNTANLGMYLYTHYIYAFEIVALILLVGMIAAISLTIRPRRSYTRYMPVSEQLKARPEERLKVVKLDASQWEALPVETPTAEKGEG